MERMNESMESGITCCSCDELLDAVVGRPELCEKCESEAPDMKEG